MCLFVLVSAARADLTLVFEQRLVKSDPQGMQQVKGAAQAGESTTRLTVQLAQDWCSSEDGELIQQIDFKNRRCLLLNRQTKTYTDTALLAKIGFLSAEFRNRLMQAGLFEKMGMKDNPMDPVLMEHLFSIRGPNTVPLKGKTARGTQSWTHNGKPLFSCSTDGFKLSAEETALLVRFLRHEFGLHPDILDACRKAGRVPTGIEIYRYNMGVDHYSLKLVKSERTPAGLVRADLKAGATEETEGGLTAIVHEATAMDEADYRARCEKLKSDALAQREQGKTMDAMLLLLEYGLSCDKMAEEIESLKDAIQHDADCQHLMASINPHTKEGAEEAVKELAALEGKAQAGRRMITVFRANILTNLGKGNEAQTFLIAALKENPAQVGAWKDLGDIYYNSYEMDEAWSCWETALKLLPSAKMLEGVKTLEKDLIKTYPEFL
ncbi:MAG: hypothetical protein JSS11_01290 [Verrucomicrobia bacterium]|nr:hypothetical protein [Verrucomicrobiota bacterium]